MHSRTYRKSAKPWAILIACCIVDMIGLTVPVTMFSVFLTPIKDSLGLSMSHVQIYNTAMMVTTILTTALGSRILRLGVGKVIAASSIGIMAGYWVLALHPGVGAIVFAGIMAGCYPLLSIFTMPIVIGNWFFKNQGTWISVCIAMSGLGGLIMSPVVTSLIASYGWQAAAMMASSSLVIPFLLGAFLIRESPLPQGILPQGATAEDLEKEETDSKVAQEHEQDPQTVFMPGATYAQAVKSPAFIFCAIALFSTGFQSAYATNMNPLVQSAGYGAEAAAIALMGMSLGNLIGKPVWGILRDRIGAFLTGCFSFGLFSLGLALCIYCMFVPNGVLMTIVAFLIGFGGTSGLNMPSLYVKDSFGSLEFGKIYSSLMGVRSIGAAVVYPLVGILFDATGSYLALVVVLIVAGLIIIPTGYFSVKMGRKLWRTDTSVFGAPRDADISLQANPVTK